MILISGETPSKRSLRAKKLAAIFERKANEAGLSDAPWSLGNVRTWQNQMCDALKVRSATLRAYLDMRAKR